jgi:hypothetical protein
MFDLTDAPSKPPARRRLRRFAVVAGVLGVVALLVVTAIKVVAGWIGGVQLPSAPPLAKCTLAGSTYTVTPEQAGNAATIVGVALRRTLPERAAVIALATALQESKLQNLDYGDQDSLGLFQQRPSQGWGTPEQIMNPVYSAGIFYDHLLAVPDWSSLPLAQVAQEVQHSGYPEAYAQWEEQADVLGHVLAARVAAGLSCTFEPDDVPAERAGSNGLTTRAQSVLTRAQLELGSRRVAPRAGAPAATAAEYRSGRALDLEPAGWFSANWLVGQASALSIRRVAYAGQSWTPDHGWQRADAGQAPEDRIRVLVA